MNAKLPSLTVTKRVLLYASALISGFATMALEMLIGRTLTPYFGGTIYTWGALISVFLAGMSVGYTVSGLVADRRPATSVIAGLFLITALYMAVPSLGADLILNKILDQTDDVRIGALSAAFVLAFLPAALMAGVSPFCVRLLIEDTAKAGGLSGQVSALVTGGSICGALMTSFLFIPTFGVRSIYIGLGLLVALPAIAIAASAALGQGKGRKLSQKAVLALGACSLLAGAGVTTRHAAAAPSWPDGTLEKVDSQYNTILIEKQGRQISMDFGYRNLRYEESAMDLDHPNNLIVPYTVAMTAAVAYPTSPVRNIALVGLGGGQTVNYLLRSMPSLHFDVAELDPDVIRLAGKYFNIHPDARFHIANADGRVFLRNTKTRYDVIMLDAYRGPFVPFHLTTKEFYTLARDRLAPGGVVVQNIDPSTFFYDDALATMSSVFQSVDIYQANGNVILIGYSGPRLSDATLQQRASQRQAQLNLPYNLLTVVKQRDPFTPPSAKAKILTDDFAPVELLTTIKHNNEKWKE